MFKVMGNLLKKDEMNFYIPIILLMLASLCSVLLHGFEYSAGNNLFQIPVVLDYMNSAEGPNDIFHQSLNRYISGFWVVVSLVATEANTPLLFFAIHLIFRFMIVYMVWKITELITENSALSALLACLILFFPALFADNSPVGRNPMLDNTLNHSECVSAFVLWSFHLALKKRFNWSAVIIAVVFMINAFIGVWNGLAVGLAMLYFSRKENIKTMAIKATKMLVIFIVVALPVIIWLLSSISNPVEYEPFSFTQYLRESYPHHQFIDTHFSAAFAVLIPIMISYLYFDVLCKNLTPDHKNIFLSIFTVFVAILIFGMFLPYISDSRLLLSLYPMRIDTYIIFMMYIFVMNWCVYSFSVDDEKGKIYSLIALSSLFNFNVLLLLAAVFLGRDKKTASNLNNNLTMLLLVVAAIGHSYFGKPLVFENLWGIGGVIALFLQSGIISYFLVKNTDYMKYSYLIIAASIMGMLPDTDDSSIKIAIFIFYMFFAATIYLIRKGQVNNFFLSLSLPLLATLIFIKISPSAIWLLVLCLALILPLINKYIIPKISFINAEHKILDLKIIILFFIGAVVLSVVQYTVRGSISPKPELSTNFKDAQKWARDNTPPHTVFLTVGLQNFSILSRRPVWMDEKQHSMVVWSPENYKFWKTRWDQLRDITTLEESRKLAAKENIEFIVFSREFIAPDNVPEQCISYENKHYWIMNSCP